jgi:hypothetical protein
MESREEQQAVLEVRARLQQKFSHVQAAEVARTVEEVHHEFDGNPIRDFVPVLVERAATDRLGQVPAQRTAPPI